MAQSPEYPDLKWMPPRAYGTGRDGKAVRYIVIHYTAGSERSTSAEDGAAYDARRTDGVSTHYFVDPDSVVQCVRTRDRANAARHKGNRLGIQYELCGTVQTRAQWLDMASMATLKNAAWQVARDCRKYDIPVRRLSVAETRGDWYDFPAGPKGIVGHIDCTLAYPEDGGDHSDPGAAFPWDVFLGFVRAELEEDDMPTAEEIADAVWSRQLARPDGTKVAAGTIQAWSDARELDTRRQVLASLANLAKQDHVDEVALAAQLAPAVAAAVLAQLPAGADQVSQDEVTAAVQAAFERAFAA